MKLYLFQEIQNSFKSAETVRELVTVANSAVIRIASKRARLKTEPNNIR